ncbi:DNA-directed RNA polymerase subunit D [Candidatus Pacearchaeota archaeon]|nr:DNA-directed RNA polymerase subunit D [Candidatus Pacearchaeota archaeon]|tara:strand:+ start:145 stop:840 length:696 start_codon:yes stop_codon:yes gene_type:complete
MPTIFNTPEKLILRLKTSDSLANAIRRSVSEVQTLAIEEVEIFKNDSALYDEVLAHRLGLVPLQTEKSMTEKTKVSFKLSKKGPGTVYASDLSGSGSIAFPKTPITILNENHKLELVASASLGTGLEHAKHTPGLCFYRHLFEVKSSPEADKIIKKSKSLFKPEKSGTKWICDLNDLEVSQIEKTGKDVINETKEILFIIESFGMLSAKDILSGAVKALGKNLDSFEKAVK